MKQFFGFFIVFLTIPLLIFVQNAVISEWKEARAFNEDMTQSIELSAPAPVMPLTMKDKNGTVFREEYVEWRQPLSLSDIPNLAQSIFLESEDVEFYAHRGYNIAAIVRAFLVNSKTSDLQQGGSTITQQLIRMQFLTTDKTYERKLTELIYAAKLEKQMTKKEILEMYLNEMYFGNQVYGIGAAATYYFNRPIQALNEAEIAFIAAIPNNPSLYNPIQHFDNTKKRQERLLDVLEKSGHLTPEENEHLKKLPIQLTLKKKLNESPSYSAYVLHELEQLIGESEGFSEKIKRATDKESKAKIKKQLKDRTQEVFHSGIIIETAFDSKKQKQDEQALTSLLKPAKLQAGAIVVNNETREVISVYGGKDYAKGDFHRAFQSVRQPGSAIKPLLVYAPLFENTSYTEQTPINSGPICIGSYCPTNVGGGVYGTTSLMEAFRHSHNTAAVRLFQMTGIETSFSYFDQFRFQSLTPQDLNYPAALGGLTRGVTPAELADAYTSFIDGQYRPVQAIRAVKDLDGNVIYKWPSEKTEIWSRSTVTKMRNLMKDVVLNGSGKGVSFTTAYTGIKTGTTNTYRDLWTAGLTDRYTTAVWIGYDQPQSLKAQSDQKTHLKAISILLKE